MGSVAQFLSARTCRRPGVNPRVAWKFPTMKPPFGGKDIKLTIFLYLCLFLLQKYFYLFSSISHPTTRNLARQPTVSTFKVTLKWTIYTRNFGITRDFNPHFLNPTSPHKKKKVIIIYICISFSNFYCFLCDQFSLK